MAHSTQVASSRPVAPNLPVDPKVQQPDKTKVLRIYAGEGYFNVVLAEELRPKLAKGLAAVQIDAVKTIPVRMIVPSKADSRRMVPVPANL